MSLIKDRRVLDDGVTASSTTTTSPPATAPPSPDTATTVTSPAENTQAPQEGENYEYGALTRRVYMTEDCSGEVVEEVRERAPMMNSCDVNEDDGNSNYIKCLHPGIVEIKNYSTMDCSEAVNEEQVVEDGSCMLDVDSNRYVMYTWEGTMCDREEETSGVECGEDRMQTVDWDEYTCDSVRTTFYKLAGEHGEMDVGEYMKYLQTDDTNIAAVFVSLFDDDRSGSLSFEEFLWQLKDVPQHDVLCAIEPENHPECNSHEPSGVECGADRMQTVDWDEYTCDLVRSTFSNLAGDNGEMDVGEFIEAYPSDVDDKMLEGIHSAYDNDKNGSLSFEEFAWILKDVTRQEVLCYLEPEQHPECNSNEPEAVSVEFAVSGFGINENNKDAVCDAYAQALSGNVEGCEIGNGDRYLESGQKTEVNVSISTENLSEADQFQANPDSMNVSLPSGVIADPITDIAVENEAEVTTTAAPNVTVTYDATPGKFAPKDAVTDDATPVTTLLIGALMFVLIIV